MKTAVCMCLFGLLLSEPAQSKDKLGKIIFVQGDVDITSLNSGKKEAAHPGMSVYRDSRIRTGNKSTAEILLRDGTVILLRDVSVINILNLKRAETDPPTRIKVIAGKARISAKSTFASRSHIVKTPSAIIGVRKSRADFGIVAGRQETLIVVFEGRVEAASAEDDIVKAQILTEREEVSVKSGAAPTDPKIVPRNAIEKWFNMYIIDPGDGRIYLNREREGFIDSLLKKR